MLKRVSAPPSGLAVYIHWPYCARLCPYCDFNIYKNKPDQVDGLVAAIIADLQKWRQASGPRPLSSIHFGGGTPSLLSGDHLRRIIEATEALWDRTESVEIGLEANPKDINTAHLQNWLRAGIERLSIGVQSFDDDILAFLGRDHDAQAARQALEYAVESMPRVSVDLIYGARVQTPALLAKDLDTALNAGIGHISTYQLTIEKRTAFGRALDRGNAKSVSPDISADLFAQVLSRLTEAGFAQYEISNFAKTGSERSRHNLAYWQGADYVGVGPGAHGRLTTNNGRLATIALPKPKDYIAAVAQETSLLSEAPLMDKTAWAEEYVLMGLRIKEGISLSRFRDIGGRNLARDKIRTFVEDGFLMLQGDQLSATAKGRMVLDYITNQLLLA